MTLPICIPLDEVPDPMEITLPGGISIEHIDLLQVIQPALTPLVPIFNIVDTVVSLFNCIKAVMTMDVKTIGQCIPDLAENVGKLVKMVPQLSLPLMLIGLIDLVLAALSQARDELVHLQNQMKQISRMVDRAKELNDAALYDFYLCASNHINMEARNVGKNLASLGRLFGLINLFMSMIGAPQIPDLSSLAGKPLDEVIDPLDSLVKALKTARKAVPIP